MAVGENHPRLRWQGWAYEGTVFRWVCSDPECPGGEISLRDLNDESSDRFSWVTAELLRDGRCPNDHRLQIF